MSTISNYQFQKAYGTDRLSKVKIEAMGISSNKVDKADTDNDNVITVSEVMANDDLCTEILKSIANASNTVPKAQQTQDTDTEGNELSYQA